MIKWHKQEFTGKFFRYRAYRVIDGVWVETKYSIHIEKKKYIACESNGGFVKLAQSSLLKEMKTYIEARLEDESNDN